MRWNYVCVQIACVALLLGCNGNQGDESSEANSPHRDAAAQDASSMNFGPAGSLRVVARTGDPAPGTDGLVFAGFGPPAINDHGQVVFIAGVRAKDPRNNDRHQGGLWVQEKDGSLRLVVRLGDVAIESDSPRPVTYDTFHYGGENINNRGDVLAWIGLSRIGRGFPDQVLLMDQQGKQRLLGQATADAPQVNKYRHVLLNEAGQVAYFAEGMVPPRDRNDPAAPRVKPHYGIWLEEPDGTRRMFASSTFQEEEGASDDAMPVNAFDFRRNDQSVPLLNDRGQLLFYSKLGLYLGSADRVSMVAEMNSKNPASTLSHPPSGAGINNQGKIVFSAGLPDEDDRSTPHLMLAEQPGKFHPLLVFEQMIDGQWVVASSMALINNRGEMFFAGGASEFHALFRVSSKGKTRLITKADGAVPQIDGGMFERFSSSVTMPCMNARGEVAFAAHFTPSGPANFANRNIGIFVDDANGLHLVARTGVPLELPPPKETVASDDSSGGETAANPETSPDMRRPFPRPRSAEDKIVDDLYIIGPTGGEDGRPSCLNERGEVAFAVKYKDEHHALIVYRHRDIQ